MRQQQLPMLHTRPHGASADAHLWAPACYRLACLQRQHEHGRLRVLVRRAGWAPWHGGMANVGHRSMPRPVCKTHTSTANQRCPRRWYSHAHTNPQLQQQLHGPCATSAPPAGWQPAHKTMQVVKRPTQQGKSLSNPPTLQDATTGWQSERDPPLKGAGTRLPSTYQPCGACSWQQPGCRQLSPA
jgi:hypothetical protein